MKESKHKTHTETRHTRGFVELSWPKFETGETFTWCRQTVRLWDIVRYWLRLDIDATRCIRVLQARVTSKSKSHCLLYTRWSDPFSLMTSNQISNTKKYLSHEDRSWVFPKCPFKHATFSHVHCSACINTCINNPVYTTTETNAYPLARGVIVIVAVVPKLRHDSNVSAQS